MGVPVGSEITYVNYGILTFITRIYLSAMLSCMFYQVRLGKIPFATDATVLFVITLEAWVSAIF